MILSPAKLANLQGKVGTVLDKVYPDRFDSFRGTTRVRNNNAPDQWTETPNQILTDKACSFQLTNNQERFLAGLEQNMNFFTVKVSAGIDLQEDDLLNVRVKGNEAAKTLKVRTILRKSNSLVWRVICVES